LSEQQRLKKKAERKFQVTAKAKIAKYQMHQDPAGKGVRRGSSKKNVQKPVDSVDVSALKHTKP